MLHHSRILPIIVLKRTSLTCTSVSIQHLLPFSSLVTPNINVSKEQDRSKRVTNKNLKSKSAYDFIKATVLNNLKISPEDPFEGEIFQKKAPDIIDEREFQNIEYLLNIFQQSINNGKISIADLPKEENFEALVDAIKAANSVVISMIMKKLNINRINNLLVEDLISEDLIIATLKQLNFNESISMLKKLSIGKCRPTKILILLAQKISTVEKKELTLKITADILHSMAVLTFYDDDLIDILMTNLFEIIPKNKNILLLGSILKSLSMLRINNEKVLDRIFNMILEERDTLKSQDVCNLLMTIAALGYSPSNFNEIFEQIVKPLLKGGTLTDFELLDIVWALCILEKATPEHIQSIINYEFLKNDLFPSLPSKIIKILNINAAATCMPDYKGILLPEDSFFFKPDIVLSKEKIKLLNPIIKAMKLLLPRDNKFFNTYVNTNMGFILDAEFCVDKKCTPFPVAFRSQNINKIAIFSVTYNEMCYGLSKVMGRVTFYTKLLEQKGYKVLLLPYTTEYANQSPIARAKYINEKLRLLLENKSLK